MIGSLPGKHVVKFAACASKRTSLVTYIGMFQNKVLRSKKRQHKKNSHFMILYFVACIVNYCVTMLWRAQVEHYRAFYNRS